MRRHGFDRTDHVRQCCRTFQLQQPVHVIGHDHKSQCRRIAARLGFPQRIDQHARRAQIGKNRLPVEGDSGDVVHLPGQGYPSFAQILSVRHGVL